MIDHTSLIALSAFSGLAGAILTQVLTGVFAYYGDKRKSQLELNKAYRDKQVEVAEQFYYVTGETMAVIKKNIEHFKDRSRSRSEASINFFDKEIKKLEAYLDKLKADNWKQNLIGLYFNVSLSYQGLIEANNQSHLLFLRLLDIADKIKKTNDPDKEKLIGDYYNEGEKSVKLKRR